VQQANGRPRDSAQALDIRAKSRPCWALTLALFSRTHAVRLAHGHLPSKRTLLRIEELSHTRSTLLGQIQHDLLQLAHLFDGQAEQEHPLDVTGDQGQIPTYIGSVASCGQRVTRRCTDCSVLIAARIGDRTKKTIATAKETRVRVVADRVDSGSRLA